MLAPMKTLFLAILMALTVSLNSATFARPVQLTKGGIKAGTIIKMKVVDKLDVQGHLPKWIPKLHRGQRVKFKIAKDGDLIMLSPNFFRFNFLMGTNAGNTYSGPDLSAGNTAKNSTAALRKKSPYYKAAIALTFQQITINSDYTYSIINTVYNLE
jgi:hypothetical protein